MPAKTELTRPNIRMVPGRAWCRRLLGLLLVAAGAGAAGELYDELPAADEMAYQDDNDIDTGPPSADKRLSPILAKDVLLYRVLKALQQDSLHYSSAFRPNDLHIDDERQKPSIGYKDAVYKRRSEVYGGMGMGKGPEAAFRPHKKWKIKKGKALGSQMVCYFKLCAFRSPIA